MLHFMLALLLALALQVENGNAFALMCFDSPRQI